MKRFHILLIFLLLVSFVYSVEDSDYLSYKVNEESELKLRVWNQTDVILDAACYLDIYDETNALVINDGQMSQTARWYNYSYTFDTVGEWFVEYNCTKNNNNTILGKFVSVQARDMDNLVEINTTTQAAHTNSRTIIWLLEGASRIYDFIWSIYTPRTVTGGDVNGSTECISMYREGVYCNN